MLIDLIHNIALLVALAVSLQILGQRLEDRRVTYRVAAGLLFALVGVVGMMTPVRFAPGVIYDGRSIVLSLAGLFGGVVPAAVSSAICGAYRLYLGGPGATAGVGVIIEAAALGVCLRFLRRRDERWVGLWHLLAFGIVVHAIMLALQFLIPGGVGFMVFKRFGAPILIFYPLAFLVTAHIFLEGERRRQAGQVLAQSEERYRSLFENNHAVMLIVDPQDGRIVDANPAACAFYGWPRETLCRKRVDEINTLNSEEVRRKIEDAREAKRTHFEFTHRLADGSTRDVEVFSGPISLDGRALLYSIVHDISARRTAEEALRASEAFQRAMITCSPVALYCINMDGIVQTWNASSEKIFGWAAQEIIGKPLPIVPDENQDEFFAMRQAVVRGESSTGKEVTRLRKDGRRFIGRLSTAPLRDGSGNIIGIMGAMEDITESKRAEAERARLAMAIEQAGEMVVITDRDGMIEYVNPAFEEVTGFQRKEAIGQKPNILKSDVQDDAFYASLWQTIMDGKIWQGRLVNRRKDGTLYTEDMTVSPLHDAEGKIVNYVAVKNDITSRLALEEQYRQAQKMEAVGQLAGGVAHDFNNILQAILGYSQLLLDEAEEKNEPREELLEIKKGAERAAQLTRQLLAFSRRQVMQPKVLDLNVLIENFIKMIHRVIGEHIHLEWLPGNRLGSVYADPGMLEQALMNLCLNARDAMPDGGSLSIETQNVRIDSEYCATHAWAKPGRFVLLSVTDTGCGMPEEILGRAFDPFFTTKEEGKGTGLGLATVYGIITQHDGMINTYSEVGQGTTFKMYLPVCERDAEAIGPMLESHVTGGNETILLAEDNETVRKLAQMILERAGYRVLTASNGEEAVLVFKQNADDIALVILDVVMPRMGGNEALGHIRNVSPNVYALFSSGYSENAIHTHFVLHDGLQMIQKPYAPNALLRKVRSVLDERPNS